MSLPGIDSSVEFWKLFNEKCVQCRALIDGVSEANATESTGHLRQFLVELQAFATDSTRILPQYDIKRTQEEIQLLSVLMNQAMKTAKPRKKFKFASLSKGVARDRSSIAQHMHKDTAVVEKRSSLTEAGGSIIIENFTNEYILYSRERLSSISLDNRCQILLRSCKQLDLVSFSLIGSIRMEDLENCNIILGSCGTSVYLEGCRNLTLFVVCHQMRIHKCTNCKIYVYCKSHPIIEDCMGMEFAPFSISYNSLESDLLNAGLSTASCWNNVVDFRWHKSTPSPCWRIINPAERINPEAMLTLYPRAKEYFSQQNLCTRRDKVAYLAQPVPATTASTVIATTPISAEDDDEDEI